ncbi:MAG: cation diffusion facilitator family transporter [bacterium]
MSRSFLTQFAWLSIAASIVTMALKAAAYYLTGSVSLLSDAVESIVNLIGGVVALTMLTIAARPADKDHAYGHSKAEYFSSGVEGTLILIAALSIAYTAVVRLLNPMHIHDLGMGLLVSLAASLVNLGVALVLSRAGRKHGSITLEANSQHLMTDVWTSAGVIVGIGIVALTGWEVLDPVVAILVAANIIWTGWRLIHRSIDGLMDRALTAEDEKSVLQALSAYETEGVRFHALRTRQAGARRFVAVHVLVPGDWSVQRGHNLLERIESDIRKTLADATVFTHLEPLDDPSAWADEILERADNCGPCAPHVGPCTSEQQRPIAQQ